VDQPSSSASGASASTTAAATLDGFLADENDSLDWLFVQDIDREGVFSYDAFIAGVGAIVMGRTTYEWIRAHLAADGEPWPYAMPAWVVSHAELDGIEGADLRFVQGDVVPVHAAMVEAAGGKDLWVVGGGDLAAQFAQAGLLDELRVSIAPVTLGAGRPLFPRRFDLELVDLARNRAFACATYRVAGQRDQEQPAGKVVDHTGEVPYSSVTERRTATAGATGPEKACRATRPERSVITMSCWCTVVKHPRGHAAPRSGYPFLAERRNGRLALPGTGAAPS
jgi:dihydrofolate reductase